MLIYLIQRSINERKIDNITNRIKTFCMIFILMSPSGFYGFKNLYPSIYSLNVVSKFFKYLLYKIWVGVSALFLVFLKGKLKIENLNYFQKQIRVLINLFTCVFFFTIFQNCELFSNFFQSIAKNWDLFFNFFKTLQKNWKFSISNSIQKVKKWIQKYI